jgi:hypothetical protein
MAQKLNSPVHQNQRQTFSLIPDGAFPSHHQRAGIHKLIFDRFASLLNHVLQKNHIGSAHNKPIDAGMVSNLVGDYEFGHTCNDRVQFLAKFGLQSSSNLILPQMISGVKFRHVRYYQWL